jgi:peptidoglycan-associated lipoprotein
MNQVLWKRFSLLILVAFTLLLVGCHKPVPVPPAAPAPPPPPPPPAPTITLNADRTTITAGQSAVLSYVAANATSVTIQPGIGAVQPATTGTRQVSPTATTSFTATATGPGGTATSAAVNIAVNAPPPPTPPPAAAPPPPTPVTSNRSVEQIFMDTMQPILFDYDKSTIRPSEESKLLAEAAYLKQNPAIRFTIEGHADERGSQEYNVALGDERAAAVRKFLAGQGIAENRMNPTSYGEERPSCRQQTEQCFQENRRAAFKMS